jgi:orotate phosphoribosyltransferase
MWCLIEDVITTGGAVLAAATALRELGATVRTVICAIDRSAAGGNALAGAGIDVRSVLTKMILDSVAAPD